MFLVHLVFSRRFSAQNDYKYLAYRKQVHVVYFHNVLLFFGKRLLLPYTTYFQLLPFFNFLIYFQKQIVRLHLYYILGQCTISVVHKIQYYTFCLVI